VVDAELLRRAACSKSIWGAQGQDDRKLTATSTISTGWFVHP